MARPGAVVGIADADWDGFLVHPPDPLLHRGQEVLRAIRSIGDPGVGKRLRHLLATTGFERVVATARTNADGGAGTEAAGAFRAASFEAPTAVAIAESHRRVDRRPRWPPSPRRGERWGTSPGAFFAGFWIEALGWVPDAVEPPVRGTARCSTPRGAWRPPRGCRARAG